MSHGRGDEASFEKAAEGIIRQLATENKMGEAKVLREALSSVRPGGGNAKALSALPRSHSNFISFPSCDQGVLFFRSETEESLQRIVEEQRSASELAQAGLKAKSKILFWGPPGCGKTAAAFWLGSQLGVPVGVVRLGALITSYVGETGANLQRIFAAAAETSMVLLLDEADAVAKSRDDENDVGELRRVVNALLQALDFFTAKRSVVILATNHAFLFDNAIWRRFDDVIEFPFPEVGERTAVLRHLTSGLRVTGDLNTAARRLDGSSFEEITRTVTEVAKSQVLTRSESIDANDLVKEAQRWRRKTGAALARPRRKR